MNIIWTDKGTSNLVDGEIWVNKKLTRYPYILDALLVHEEQHMNKTHAGHVFLDLKDSLNPDLLMLGLLYFSNPSFWWQVLPAMKFKGKIYWDISTIITWLLIIGGVLLTAIIVG